MIHTLQLMYECANAIAIDEITEDEDIISAISELVESGEQTVYDDQSSLLSALPKMRDFLSALNMVLMDISTRYIPIVKSVTIDVVDEELSTDSISNIYKVSKIYNEYGKEVRHNRCIPNGIYKVYYHYIPYYSDILNTEFDAYVQTDMVVYGMCNILCKKYGRLEESYLYETMYTDALPKKLATESFIMPARRWE